MHIYAYKLFASDEINESYHPHFFLDNYFQCSPWNYITFISQEFYFLSDKLA